MFRVSEMGLLRRPLGKGLNSISSSESFDKPTSRPTLSKRPRTEEISKETQHDERKLEIELDNLKKELKSRTEVTRIL